MDKQSVVDFGFNQSEMLELTNKLKWLSIKKKDIILEK